MQKISTYALLLVGLTIMGGVVWASSESVLATVLMLAGLSVFVVGNDSVMNRIRARRGQASTAPFDVRDISALSGKDLASMALVFVIAAVLGIAGVLVANAGGGRV